MIVSYRDRRTRELAAGGWVRELQSISRRAQMRLDQLDAATCIQDPDLPGNRLKVLSGDRAGQYSIRIND